MKINPVGPLRFHAIYRWLCLSGCFLLATAATTLHATTIINDTFSTIDTSVWTAGSGGGQGAPTSNGSSVTMTAPGVSASQRSTLISTNNNISPFGAEKILTLTFSGLSISNTTSGSSGFYAMVGNVALTASGTLVTQSGTGNAYYFNEPVGDTGFLGFMISQSNGAASLTVRDRGAIASATPFTLSAIPTDVVWTINGLTNTWSLTLTGATFSGGTFNGLSTASGSFSNYDASRISGGSYLAIGALNTNTVSSATSVSLDSLVVTSVPEPKAIVLTGLALAVGIGAALRRLTRDAQS